MIDPGFLCIKETLPGMGRDVTEICKKTFSEMYFKYSGNQPISCHLCARMLFSAHTGYGFFTQDLALKLKNGGYRVTGRLNNAMRIQGMWLDVASVEDQMVRESVCGCPHY